jgi:uncharacterized cupin superfamily protein
MADLGSGVYLSRIDTDEWQPHEETGGSVQIIFEEDGTTCGLWRRDPNGTLGEPHELPARETFVVLEGTVRIEIMNGPTLELGEGDIASLPKGAVTTWRPSPEFKEIWLYS